MNNRVPLKSSVIKMSFSYGNAGGSCGIFHLLHVVKSLSLCYSIIQHQLKPLPEIPISPVISDKC